MAIPDLVIEYKSGVNCFKNKLLKVCMYDYRLSRYTYVFI